MSEPTPPLVDVRGMTKRFGALTALDDVSLRLAPGAFHAILGENGAGKSTLVKLLLRFYDADRGSAGRGDLVLLVDGREWPAAGRARHGHVGIAARVEHLAAAGPGRSRRRQSAQIDRRST